MKKKDIVALSALVLASVATVTTASANADEKKPALDDSAVVQVDKPTAPASADTKPAPAEPAKDISGDKQPEKPVTPPSDDKGVTVEPAKDFSGDKQPEKPVTPPSDDKGVTVEDGKKDDGNKDSSENPKPAEPSQPSSDDKGIAPVLDGNNKPAPGPTPNPSKKPSEPTIPVTPTVEKPVVTDKGAEIVGTDNGKAFVKDHTTGTIQVVAAEKVGGKVDKDGTIVVKDKGGKNVRLPKAGEGETFLTTLILILLAFVGFRQIKPFEKNNWAVS